MIDQDETGEPAEGESEFEQLADERQSTLVEEFWFFLIENKKWWMIPILIVFALLGLLIALAATGAAPFIYPLI
jgi:hypothetical protein